MSILKFYKYQGTGNDFVMVDDRKATFPIENHELVKKLCDRKFGVGADGFVLIRDHDQYDFEMIYYNSDGHLSTLCGNGSRCTVKFAAFLNMIESQTTFSTSEGPLKARIKDDLVYLNMPDVEGTKRVNGDWFIHTGSPHHVQFVEDAKATDVFTNGRAIRNGAPYGAEGSNVNFVQRLREDYIFVRTYERGVEDETLSCGTGVTASALIYGMQSGLKEIRIKTLGGELKVQFEMVEEDKFRHIKLIGPATQVFHGEIEVPFDN